MDAEKLILAKNIVKEFEKYRNELSIKRVKLLKLPLPLGGNEFISHLDEINICIEKMQYEIMQKIKT